MKSSLLCTLLVGALGSISLLAQVGPGWYLVDPPPPAGFPQPVVTSLAAQTAKGSTSSARSFFTDPITTIRQTGQPVVSEEITPEITALAANLENDPKRIYDYVHNYIRYVHYFGSKKGALLTLLEGSGNDFDQCALLTALLRAAGQNSGTAFTVTYQFGAMSTPNTTWSRGALTTIVATFTNPRTRAGTPAPSPTAPPRSR
jgi:hypothetical protein